MGTRLVEAVQAFLRGREGEHLNVRFGRDLMWLQGLGVLVCRQRAGGRHLIAEQSHHAAQGSHPPYA